MGAGESKIEGVDILSALFRIQTEDEMDLSLQVEIISWFSLEELAI